VTGVCGDDSFEGTQGGVERQHIGLCAAGDKVHLGIGGGAFLADECGGFLTKYVCSVAGALLQIGVYQSLQNPGMGTFAVVVLETVHMYDLAVLVIKM
jgi:hypothetical protein